MFKSNNNRCLFSLVTVLFLLVASVAHSSPIQLQQNEVVFPVSVNFPSTPQSSYTQNPALSGSFIYVFFIKDASSKLTFAASITTLPKNSGLISERIANVMVTEVLNSQVENVDHMLGIKGEISEEASAIPKLYPSRTIEVWRKTKPPQFGRYTSFMVDRLLITVFASGLSSTQNRIAIRNFVNSVAVHKQSE